MNQRFAVCWLFVLVQTTAALCQDSPTLQTVDYGIYQDCPVLKNETTRVVFCPQKGGRILEYSLGGKNALFVSDYELTGRESAIGGKSPSAGRFDIGPEKIVPKRTESFFGEWKSERTGSRSLRMTSLPGKETGVTLIRDFELDAQTSRLFCTQTILNNTQRPRQYCHWSRTFGNKAGIVLIPLEGFPRFPKRYVRYEGKGILISPQDDNIRIRDGFLEIIGPPTTPKLGMDSYAGWLAHQQPSGLLFFKQFPTYPNRNYCELAGITISTWTPETGHTVELEPIGPSETIGPGERAEFTEVWTLVENPYPKQGQPFDLNHLRKLHDRLQPTDVEGPQ